MCLVGTVKCTNKVKRRPMFILELFVLFLQIVTMRQSTAWWTHVVLARAHLTLTLLACKLKYEQVNCCFTTLKYSVHGTGNYLQQFRNFLFTELHIHVCTYFCLSAHVSKVYALQSDANILYCPWSLVPLPIYNIYREYF